MGVLGQVFPGLLAKKKLDAVFVKWHDATRSDLNSGQSNAVRDYCQAKSDIACHFSSMPTTTTTFWDRVQEVYEGLNPPEIASAVGKTKQTVYRWRDGDMPPLDVLVEICESRRVSLSWLAMGLGPKRIDATLGVDSIEAQLDRRLKELVGPKGVSKTSLQDLVAEVTAGALRRLSKTAGVSVEELIADGERRVLQNRREEGAELPDENGSKEPHSEKVDRPDLELRQGIDEKLWLAMLAIIQGQQRMEQLLQAISDKL